MPDLDLVTASGPTRVYALLHEARPVLIHFKGSDPLPHDGSADRTVQIRAIVDGVCELPVIGVVPLPKSALIRPDGHVAWVDG